MANWKQQIDLASVLHQYEDEFEDADGTESIPQKLKDDIINEIKDVPELNEFVEDINDCLYLEELNDILERIYDKADAYLIWCGL